MSTRENYLDEGLCAQCGGDCCKTMPGSASPEDIAHLFGPDLRMAVQRALDSGQWMVDWWEGDPRGLHYDDPKAVSQGYYLRPRTIDDPPDRVFYGSWGGPCSLLIPGVGCSLEPADRPVECRMLEPRTSFECAHHHANGRSGKHDNALAWLPYHYIFEEE